MNINFLYKITFRYLLFLTLIICCGSSIATMQTIDAINNHTIDAPLTHIIEDIVVEGNRYIKKEAILNRLPYKIGDLFDVNKSAIAIQNIYLLGSFKQIKIEIEKTSNTTLVLYIIVEEKKLLAGITYSGNKHISTTTIKEKLAIERMSSVDEETLQRLCKRIEKIYQEEHYHRAVTTYNIIQDPNNNDKATALFIIEEGPKSHIQRVHFTGNNSLADIQLRNILFTREYWLFGFMDNAGTYNKDMLDADRQRIEYFYRDHGFLMIKTMPPVISFTEDGKNISVLFDIKEGNQFFVNTTHIIGDDILTEQNLQPCITMKTGSPYSQTKMIQCINNIKDMYGALGYISCDVYPQIKPNEHTNTVDLTFHIERGKKLYVNSIYITGNKVTCDKVIRRQFDIAEGELLTTQKLLSSKTAVSALSFFDHNNVHWEIHHLSDNLADLEMQIKEIKTGDFNAMLTYGTDQNNPKSSMRGIIALQKTNLLGLGWDIGGLIQADRHRLRKIEAHFFDPHIFDSNISAGIFFYKRWDNFEQWKTLDKTPEQRIKGGNIKLGLWLPKIAKQLQLILDFGCESIHTNKPAIPDSSPTKLLFDPIVKRTFQEGTFTWIGIDLVKDTRDHQVYPKSGYKFSFGLRFTPPGFNSDFSFMRNDVEASCYTILIDKFILDDSLVLGLHGKIGSIRTLNYTKPIPYKELFHIGGQSTVRGFIWGSISPAWVTGDPLGARNAVIVNSELIFPLIPDYSMKAHVFYDAGAGWDAPKNDITDTSLIKRDKFNIRHAIGFGLNLSKPMPAKIDWGFKLDRRKQDGESAHEFHLSMNYAW